MVSLRPKNPCVSLAVTVRSVSGPNQTPMLTGKQVRRHANKERSQLGDKAVPANNTPITQVNKWGET